MPISTKSPYQEVSKQTISNWIKWVLKKSGVDTQTFKTHSTISASLSAAKYGNFQSKWFLKLQDESRNVHLGSFITNHVIKTILIWEILFLRSVQNLNC